MAAVALLPLGVASARYCLDRQRPDLLAVSLTDGLLMGLGLAFTWSALVA